jgi:hypothetical protein
MKAKITRPNVQTICYANSNCLQKKLDCQKHLKEKRGKETWKYVVGNAFDGGLF